MISALNPLQPLNGNNYLRSLCIAFVLAFQLFKVNAQQTAYSKDTLNLAVLMPFCSKEILSNELSPKSALGNACRSYFEGLSLGLDSMSKNGIPIQVNVFDTKNDTVYFKQLLKKNEILNANLIIGPVVAIGQQLMENFSKQSKIYHVSPLLTLTKSKIEDPYLICMNPDLASYADIVLEQLKKEGHTNINLVVFSGKGKNDKIISSRINKIKNNYPDFQIQCLEIDKNINYKNYYNLDKTNLVWIDAENEFLVNSTLKLLADTSQFIDIHVIGNRKWLEYNAINFPLWKHLDVTILSPYFLSSDNKLTQDFIEKYKEMYNKEPDEYAIAGFDQALVLVDNMAKNEGHFNPIALKNRQVLVGSEYVIGPKPHNKGFQNNYLNQCKFNANFEWINAVKYIK
jgi:hypothetical protein